MSVIRAKQRASLIHHRTLSSTVNEVTALELKFEGHPELFAPHRKLIGQGTLMKVCRFKDVKYMFFLFNDMLVYASYTTANKFRLHQKIPIDTHFIVEDLIDVGSKKNRIKIHNSKKPLIIYTKSEEEKKAWLEDLIETLQTMAAANFSLDLLGEHKLVKGPTWHPAEDRRLCQFCFGPFDEKLQGEDKVHCRACGDVFCKRCTEKKVGLRTFGYRAPQPVCPRCYQRYRPPPPPSSSPSGDNHVNSNNSSTSYAPDNERRPSFSMPPIVDGDETIIASHSREPSQPLQHIAVQEQPEYEVEDEEVADASQLHNVTSDDNVANEPPDMTYQHQPEEEQQQQ